MRQFIEQPSYTGSVNKSDLCSDISSKHSEHFVKKEANNATSFKVEVRKNEPEGKKSQSKESEQEMIKPEEKDGGENVKVKLSYVLYELKNLKVAKANAKRPMKAKRCTMDEVNVRLGANSALYLVSKEELLKLPMGYVTTEKGTKLEVEAKIDQIEKDGKNLASIMKVKVTEIKSGFESKATINMYHTNQGFHIQGGRRSGNVTSCSLVADFLVDFFKRVFLQHAIII